MICLTLQPSVLMHALTYCSCTHCENAGCIMCPTALQSPPPCSQHVHREAAASVLAHRLWCSAQSQIFQHMAFLGRWAALTCPEVRLHTSRLLSSLDSPQQGISDLEVLAASDATGQKPGLGPAEAEQRCFPVQCNPTRPAPHCWVRVQCPRQGGPAIPMRPNSPYST